MLKTFEEENVRLRG